MKETVKKITTSVLIALLLFSLCSCENLSGDGSENNNSTNSNISENDDGTWYMGGGGLLFSPDEKEIKELFESIEDTIDPAVIYSSLNYTEEMLHGYYLLNNFEKDVKDVRTNLPFEIVEFNDGSQNVSSLPVSILFGADCASAPLGNYSYKAFEEVTDIEIAVLTFASDDNIMNVPCIYEVAGKTVVFKRIKITSNDDEPLEYKFTGGEFKYDFNITGPNITLSKNNSSLTLTSYCFTENDGSKMTLNCYSLYGSPLIDNLDYFSSYSSIYNARKKDGSFYDSSLYKFCEDGRLTVYLTSEDENGNDSNFIKQYAYIVQSSGTKIFPSFNLILFDGEKEYYYTDDSTERAERELMEQGADISNMTEEEIEAIAEKKSDLYDDLFEEFKNQGINVTINRNNGEIAMGSSVLFGGDSAELTDEGKDLLNKFTAAYSSIIYNEKYDGFIEKTMIEGHTAPIAGDTYENGLPLSIERADNVKEYCISSSTDANSSQLAATLESVGLSNSKPVYDANGDIDMGASRRVSFKLIVAIK